MTTTPNALPLSPLDFDELTRRIAREEYRLSILASCIADELRADPAYQVSDYYRGELIRIDGDRAEISAAILAR